MVIFKASLLLSSLVLAFLAVYALRFSHSRGSLVFSTLLFACFFYSFGYSFELESQTVAGKIFWLHVEYIGIPAIPVLWLIFSLQFTGKKKWITPGVVIFLSLMALATITIEHTNQTHHWFYRNVESVQSGKYYITVLTEGTWYWIHVIFSNVVITIATLLFFLMYLRSSLLYRKQALIMLVGSLVPWFGHLLYLFRLTPLNLDTGPVFMMASGIAFTWGFYRYRILDIVPIAAENILQSMKEGVVILDREYRVIHFNPSAREISNDFNAKAIGKLINKDFNELSEILGPVFTGNSDIKILSRPAGGIHRSYQVNVSPVMSGDKEPEGWTVIFNDITELQKVEDALREGEKKYALLNASKDKFFRIISHDLKNPFQHLMGLADILKRELPEMNHEELTRIINMIHTSATTGNKLLENLLVWINSQTDNLEFAPQKIHLREIINEAVLPCKGPAESKNISLSSEIHPGLFIRADRNMIDLVFRNLITNAIKFTRRGGEVRISARQDQQEITISVKDNGIGIPGENLDNLFRIEKIRSSPGTEKENGTGLGLVLCKEFVDKNNGTIRVESEPGKGSDFIISFPAYDTFNG